MAGKFQWVTRNGHTLPVEDKKYTWDTPLSEALLLATMSTVFAITFAANSGHENCKVIRSKNPGPECSTTYFSISREFGNIYNSSTYEPDASVALIINGNAGMMSRIDKNDWCNYYLSPYYTQTPSLQVGSTQIETEGIFVFHHPDQSTCWITNCTWDYPLQITTSLMVSSRDASITLQYEGIIDPGSDMAKYILSACTVNTWVTTNTLIDTEGKFYPDDVCSIPTYDCEGLPNGRRYYGSILKSADPSHCATQLTFYYMALSRTLMCNSNFTYPSPQIRQQTPTNGFVDNFNEDVSYLTYTCTQCTSRSTYETLSITAAGIWTIFSAILFGLRVSYKAMKSMRSISSSSVDSKYNGLDETFNRISM
eukprot:jgi/Bigna1/136706/aug1.35_g11414